MELDCKFVWWEGKSMNARERSQQQQPPSWYQIVKVNILCAPLPSNWSLITASTGTTISPRRHRRHYRCSSSSSSSKMIIDSAVSRAILAAPSCLAACTRCESPTLTTAKKRRIVMVMTQTAILRLTQHSLWSPSFPAWTRLGLSCQRHLPFEQLRRVVTHPAALKVLYDCRLH